jgi:integrase
MRHSRVRPHPLALKAVTDRHSHELVTTFGPLKLKAIRESWVSAGHVRGQINKRVGRLKRMIGWAVEEELCPACVHHALKAIQGLKKGRTEAPEGKKVLPVPDAWVDAIRSHVSQQVWAMIRLQKLTGMRPGEVVLMRTIDINTASKIWEYRPIETKMEHLDRERIVFIGPKAQAVLLRWLRPELESFLFSPREVTAERFLEARRKRKTPVQPSQRNRSKMPPPANPRRTLHRSKLREGDPDCLREGWDSTLGAEPVAAHGWHQDPSRDRAGGQPGRSRPCPRGCHSDLCERNAD